MIASRLLALFTWMRFVVFCMHMYIYILCYLYTKRMYGVNYVGNNFILIEKNPELAIISSLILSNSHLYEKREN